MSEPLSDAKNRHNKQVVGSLIWYACESHTTMRVALSNLASTQMAGTRDTDQALCKFLNYCATHPDAVIRYHSSGMVLYIASDASYLTATKVRRRVGGHY